MVGTDIVVPVDDNGEFLLSDVPDGTVRLRFFGNGIDVTTELSNVSSNQAIVVQIQLSGSSVVIVSEVREGKLTLCHAESGSRYHSIVVAESSEPAHRAHGDGKIGDPVPGKPNRTFAADCTLLGPEVDIEKATNGQDADRGAGPEIPVGQPVTWTYVVRNIGTVDLTAVQVTDDQGVTVNCSGQTTLAAGASMTCTGSGVATLGPYANIGTVTATWMSSEGTGTVTDSDASHYVGIDPNAPDDDAQERIVLCHKTGNGRYLEHEVSKSAEQAHRAHGDAMKGEPVPGVPGKVFSSSCVPQ